MRKSFTLIELIVVIGIIALLSGLGASAYNGFQQAARDQRRKNDLDTITKALNAYYAVHGRFPPATGCSVVNCYIYSTAGPNWIPELVSGGYIEELPVDPINRVVTTSTVTNDIGPWSVNYNNHVYAYGNVRPQEYDLTARLENPNDPDRCGLKNYKFVPSSKVSWCQAFGGTFSNQIYELSPNRY